MTSSWCHLSAFRVICLNKNSRQFICTLRSWNCQTAAVHRETPRFMLLNLWPDPSPWSWMPDIGDHGGTFIQTDIHSVDELKQRLILFWCYPHQELSIRLLANGVKGVKYRSMFVRRAVISTTLYKFTHNPCIWLVLCDWLAQMLCTFFCKNICIRNVDIYWPVLIRYCGNTVKVGWKIIFKRCALIISDCNAERIDENTVYSNFSLSIVSMFYGYKTHHLDISLQRTACCRKMWYVANARGVEICVFHISRCLRVRYHLLRYIRVWRVAASSWSWLED